MSSTTRNERRRGDGEDRASGALRLRLTDLPNGCCSRADRTETEAGAQGKPFALLYIGHRTSQGHKTIRSDIMSATNVTDGTRIASRLPQDDDLVARLRRKTNCRESRPV